MLRKEPSIKKLSHDFRVFTRIHHPIGGAYKQKRASIKGNTWAAAANMTKESHERRMSGLFKAWQKCARLSKGEKLMTVRKKSKKRAKLRKTIAMEHRDLQDTARKSSAAVMERLAEIVADSSTQPSVVVAAAQVIFDRAYGKASQTNINANLNADGKPSEISQAELDTRVAKALERVEALTGGKAKARPRKKRPPDLRELDRDPNSSTQH